MMTQRITCDRYRESTYTTEVFKSFTTNVSYAMHQIHEKERNTLKSGEEERRTQFKKFALVSNGCKLRNGSVLCNCYIKYNARFDRKYS